MNKIKIVALFGEAGSGKDYLYNKIVHWDEESIQPFFNQIVKSTTRPPRENEVDGINYHFLSSEEFLRQREQGTLVGTSEYRDWYYGINTNYISINKPNIVVLDIQQIRDLINKDNIDLLLFKITASPKTRLMRQLNREQKPDVDEIIRRFIADKKEYSTIDFEYIELFNETSLDADTAILEIFKSSLTA